MITLTTFGKFDSSTHRFMSLHEAKATAGRLFQQSRLVLGVRVEVDGVPVFELQKNKEGVCIFKMEA